MEWVVIAVAVLSALGGALSVAVAVGLKVGQYLAAIDGLNRRLDQQLVMVGSVEQRVIRLETRVFGSARPTAQLKEGQSGG